jgi:hypothetical protein
VGFFNAFWAIPLLFGFVVGYFSQFLRSNKKALKKPTPFKWLGYTNVTHHSTPNSI